MGEIEVWDATNFLIHEAWIEALVEVDTFNCVGYSTPKANRTGWFVTSVRMIEDTITGTRYYARTKIFDELVKDGFLLMAEDASAY